MLIYLESLPQKTLCSLAFFDYILLDVAKPSDIKSSFRNDVFITNKFKNLKKFLLVVLVNIFS